MNPINAISVSQSKTVKIHAPGWFKQPDFQRWYNNKLGRGLATWQNSGQPLSNTTSLSAIECLRHAQDITNNVINADVLYVPNKALNTRYEAELAMVDKCDNALREIVRTLEQAAEQDGLGIDQIQRMHQEFKRDIMGVNTLYDAFFEGHTDDEISAYESAEKALDDLYSNLLTRIQRNNALNCGGHIDCFVTVEPQSAEGPDNDLPQPYWDIVVREAHKAADDTENCHVIVWISPA